MSHMLEKPFFGIGVKTMPRRETRKEGNRHSVIRTQNAYKVVANFDDIFIALYEPNVVEFVPRRFGNGRQVIRRFGLCRAIVGRQRNKIQHVGI